jgi:hypothetical protein
VTETENTQDDAVETVTTAAAETLEASGDLVQLEAEQLLQMTIAELKVYADQRQIDLGAATRKGDMVDAILGGVELSHYGPVVDELLDKAGIPIDRVISRQFKVGKTSLAVGWFDQHGTPVGRFLGITPNQAEQIRDELNDFALRGLDTLTSAARETRQ